MKRKNYLKPTTCVINLDAACPMLAGSDPSSAPARDYGEANSNVPDTEKDENGEWVWN